jgi:hypothetical protein
MTKKRIFVASARESQTTFAQPIAQHLSSCGYDVKRWWLSFAPGDVTIDRLQELVGEVDAAVFLCMPTDKVWYRGKESDTPRDNVLLEFGLFLQGLTRHKAIIVTDKTTRLPSDLDGLAVIHDDGDVNSTAERIGTHLKARFAKPSVRVVNKGVIHAEIDPKIAEVSVRRPLPTGWHQRSLYVGNEGAHDWMAIAAEPTFRSLGQRSKVRSQVLSTMDGARFETFVSLGPGDGFLDMELMIAAGDPSIRYIPVDISEGLLFNACSLLAEHADVPIGIVSDFEERMPFIGRRVRAHSAGRLVVGLLGNTFGNLDRFESSLLDQLATWMSPGDCLLLNVNLAPETVAIDPAYLAPKDHPELRRRFFTNGWARQTGKPPEELLHAYSERVVLQPGVSEVPGTTSYDFVDSITQVKIQNLRWYDWKELCRWLEEKSSFRIRKASHFYYGNHLYGEGVILLDRDSMPAGGDS